MGSNGECWACGHDLTSQAHTESDLLADLNRARSRRDLHGRVLCAYLALFTLSVTVLSLDITLDGPAGWLWLYGILGIASVIASAAWFTDGLGGYEKLSENLHRLEKAQVRAALGSTLHVDDAAIRARIETLKANDLGGLDLSALRAAIVKIDHGEV